MGTMAADSHRTSKCAKLFFCFFSSSSSSSMKISRSILSPARHKDHPFSLSSSITRRLTSNGSLKGAQSPFYPNTASASTKKRGGATLDNPEPSSPKVTCIGQVRVKSKKKKHGRKLRTPSRRRSGGADGSFRRSDNWGSADLNCKQASFTENRHRTQRWVHLPLTICQGLKGLGGSSCCFSSSRERESKREKSMRTDLEVEEEFEAKLDAIDHVEVEHQHQYEHQHEEDEEEEEGRVSFSVPPKNALLLMRCRSDPMRVAALSRRLLESPLPDGNEGMDLEGEEATDLGGKGNEESEAEAVMEDEEKQRETEHFDEDDSVMDGGEREEPQEEEEEDCEISSTMAEEEEENVDSLSAAAAAASENEDEQKLIEEEEEEEGRESASSSVRSDSESDEDLEKESTKEMETVKVKATGERVGSEENEIHKSELLDRENATAEESGDGAISVLPDCLLLMMREPKVSMEVSKETWVCSTDFKRILPERRRPANKTLADGEEDQPKNKRADGALSLSRAPKPAAVKQRQQTQAARSSCSLPGPISTAQKLPRCKSEPRTAAAKLMPSETCMWKSRKVEQLRRSTVEVVGPAAGVGF